MSSSVRTNRQIIVMESKTIYSDNMFESLKMAVI